MDSGHLSGTDQIKPASSPRTPPVFPDSGLAFSMPTDASAATPHRAPAGFPADVAFGHSGHADTANSCHSRSASVGDLRDHAVRLMQRRGRHRLRRCCDSEGKGSNGDQLDHRASPNFFQLQRINAISAALPGRLALEWSRARASTSIGLIDRLCNPCPWALQAQWHSS